MNIERGSIYFADLGVANGQSVQTGYRPVLNIQSNAGKNSPTFLVIPLTSKRKGLPMHAEIRKCDCFNGRLKETSYGLCEQIRVIPRDAIHKKICDVQDRTLDNVYDCLMVAMGFQSRNREKVLEVL